jgi:hypothetical protein
MKGHTYYLYDPAHLTGAAHAEATGQRSLTLCGDSLGLAHPLTAEGILPAVISGRLAAEAILAGDPASYPARLAAHPVLEDYRRVFRLRARPPAGSVATRRAAPAPLTDGAAAPSPGDSPGCSRAPACPRRCSSTPRWRSTSSQGGPRRDRHRPQIALRHQGPQRT